MIQPVKIFPAHEATDRSQPGPCIPPSTPELRHLSAGDYLFKEADVATCVFRVEAGVVAVFERRIGKPAGLIEMAGQGDYIGLGCLNQRRDNARAVVDCVVRALPRSEFAILAEGDPKLRQKQEDAIERDFESGKILGDDRGRSSPVERLAAFLVSVSRQNEYDGRDPAIVSDSLRCGVVSRLLNLDISTTSDALRELQSMDLVEPYPGSALRLKDIEGLERIADGDCQAVEWSSELTGTEIEAPPGGASRLSSIVRPAARAEPTKPGIWKDELYETTWLASFVFGLSVTSVGLAITLTLYLL